MPFEKHLSVSQLLLDIQNPRLPRVQNSQLDAIKTIGMVSSPAPWNGGGAAKLSIVRGWIRYLESKLGVEFPLGVAVICKFKTFDFG